MYLHIGTGPVQLVQCLEKTTCVTASLADVHSRGMTVQCSSPGYAQRITFVC